MHLSGIGRTVLTISGSSLMMKAPVMHLLRYGKRLLIHLALITCLVADVTGILDCRAPEKVA